ncbi:TPA: RpoE-regulated lipoprotein [Citrobacter farmeri]|nr:RpoE-regulated lipoprotein [Citrobacter farmeri]
MKSLRVLLCAMPLVLTGCSTLSSVNWSAANPWNWFGSSTEVTEQGVGALTASTPLDEQAIADALDGDYRLRSGMKTENGNVVRFFEAMNGDKVAMVIHGEQGSISRIDVLDSKIPSDAGVDIGTPFSDLYSKAFGNCQPASHDEQNAVECKAEGSQHISYLFTGEWKGPEGLMPPDDTLKAWKVSKIIWRR